MEDNTNGTGMGKQKSIEIDPKLEPLYKSLIELDIKHYLCSAQFLNFCKKVGCETSWLIYMNDIENFYNIPVNNRLEKAEYAFRLLLDGVFELHDRNESLSLLGNLIRNFRENLESERKLSEVKKSILDLGYNEDEIAWIFGN